MIINQTSQALSKTDRDFLSILSRGYMKSALSMSRFSGTSVLCGASQSFKNQATASLFDGKYSSESEELYLLSTDHIGDASCKSFLVLTKREAEVMVSNLSIPTMGNIPKEEIIKEIDNLLAAGVTSVLSDHMKKTLYGGVPILREVQKSTLFSTIQDDLYSLDFDLNDSDYFVVSRTKFMFTDLKIYPYFFWVIPSDFMNM
jgi:hypothetical protein